MECQRDYNVKDLLAGPRGTLVMIRFLEYPGYILSVTEEVFRSFAEVKVETPQCKNTHYKEKSWLENVTEVKVCEY